MIESIFRKIAMFVPMTNEEEGTLFSTLWQEPGSDMTKGIENGKDYE